MQRGEAGVEGREESEGQKDRSCGKRGERGGGGGEGGEGRGEEGRRCYFNTSVVCSSGPAGKRGMELFKTLHLHELDRPLENTRATFEKATLYKVKWERSGRARAHAHTLPCPHTHTHFQKHTRILPKLSALKYWHDTLQYPDGSE